jgi:hypothetical protein
MRRFTPLIVQDALTWFRHQLPNIDPKDLLPLELEVSKGVIIVGNASTPNLLTAEFKKTNGTFGVVPVRHITPLPTKRHSNSNIYYSHVLNLTSIRMS